MSYDLRQCGTVIYILTKTITEKEEKYNKNMTRCYNQADVKARTSQWLGRKILSINYEEENPFLIPQRTKELASDVTYTKSQIRDEL